MHGRTLVIIITEHVGIAHSGEGGVTDVVVSWVLRRPDGGDMLYYCFGPVLLPTSPCCGQGLMSQMVHLAARHEEYMRVLRPRRL